jgi:hypothetical protein
MLRVVVEENTFGVIPNTHSRVEQTILLGAWLLEVQFHRSEIDITVEFSIKTEGLICHATDLVDLWQEVIMGMLKWAAPLDSAQTYKVILNALYHKVVQEKLKAV